MSYATYTHVGDPSGSPSADILFTAVENGAPGNDLTIKIDTTTVAEDVGVTVDLDNIEIVALRAGSDTNYADSTLLADFVSYLNGITAFSEKVVATLINTASGAKLWGTGGVAESLSGGAGDVNDFEATIDPDISFAEIQPNVAFGLSAQILPEVSFDEIETSVAYGTPAIIEPEIEVSVEPVVTASRDMEINPNISVSVGISAMRDFPAYVTPDISVSVSFAVMRAGTTVCDVVRDILAQWGLELPCKAPQFARMAAVDTLNQAMQTVWNQAKDRRHWTRQTVTVTYPADATELKLTDTIQNVIGHVRSAGRTLVPLGNRHEAENFEAVFGESADNPPTAYFIDTSAQSGADPCRVSLMLRPIPSTERTVDVDAVLECPRYTTLDLESCPVVPIPHRYVESLLMPVARYLSMQNRLFANEENRQSIEQGFAIASAAMDQSDPTTTTARKGGNDERR